MKKVGIYLLANRIRLFAAFALLAVIFAEGASGQSQVLAQDSGDRAISQAQRAVRSQLTAREG